MTKCKWFPNAAFILALMTWASALLYNLYFAWFLGLVSLVFYFMGRRVNPHHRLNTAALVILIVGDALSIVNLLLLF